jgi:hypothetical protein
MDPQSNRKARTSRSKEDLILSELHKIKDRVESMWGYMEAHFHRDVPPDKCLPCIEHSKSCPKCHE